ncbi:MAG TPA: lysylphosphatidylglycerol synthase transmembrane domain-containing protein [Candidatus Saccharimonadales bacterium]|nr:lysylphosphatidylglycerol synthase transmembrane domain-containing protein [Candidatus Saccharimonadales bacterium]
MAKQSFFRRNWKLIVNIITVVVLVALVYIIRDQIVETFANLQRVNWQVLLLIIPLTVLGYHAQTKMYMDMFQLLGHKLHYKFTARVTLELNFVNQVFPSGGVSGISYFGVRMRSANITATQASLVQLMKLLLLFVSFEALLIIGLLILALEGKANDLMILVAGSITTLLAIGTVAFVLIIGSQRRIHATFTAITRVINKFSKVFRRGERPDLISIERAETIVSDLHGTYKLIERQYRNLRAPFVWALLYNLSAILTIYVVYVAFDEWVNVGAIILAYSVANFAGLVSVLPGGAGIYEALMTAVLAAGGIPAALSLPVTVMYRVLSTVIQLPPGYYFYHKSVHQTGKTPLDQPHES